MSTTDRGDRTSGDPAQRLLSELRDLHLQAGSPSFRAIARDIGSISHTSVAEILGGRRLPSWQILSELVAYLDGDEQYFRRLWAAASTDPAAVPNTPAHLGSVLKPDGSPVGTCFQVSAGIMATAWHVLSAVGAEVGDEVLIEPLAGRPAVPGQVLAVDERHDLALLTIPESTSDTRVLGFAPSDGADLATAVVVTGASSFASRGAARYLTVVGRWAGTAVRGDGVTLGRIEGGEVVPGMSGAPVLRSSDGYVLGVVSARYNSADQWMRNTAWVVRTEDLLQLLGEYSIPSVVVSPGEVAAAATVESSLRHSTRTSIFGGVPPRELYFTGREALLREVRQALPVDGGASPVVLCGAPGIGKSALAIEYAYRFQNEYDVVWWIPANDDSHVRRSYLSLSRRLGLPEAVDLDDVAGLVSDALRALAPRRWLLVFDGAEDEERLRAYLPAGDGHVVISSRNRHWLSARTIEVEVFSPEESGDLLHRRWPDLAVSEAQILADLLGQLPIALQQAASVHIETGMPFSAFEELYDENAVALLDVGTLPGYPASLSDTFRLAVEELRDINPEAVALLELCARLGTVPISVGMLLRAGRRRDANFPEPLNVALGNEIRLRLAIRDIGRCSLARLDSTRDLIQVQALLRAFIIASLPPERRAQVDAAAHRVLVLSDPGRPEFPDTWPAYAHIAPHVSSSDLLGSPDQIARASVLHLINYAYATGDYLTCRQLAEQAIERWRDQIGGAGEAMLLAQRWLADAHRALGEYQTARELNDAVLRRLEVEFGPQDERTLSALVGAAADLRIRGDFSRALALDESTRETYRGVLGDEDLQTMRSTHHLATDLRLLGRFEEALRIDTMNAENRTENLGPDHPDTISSSASLVRDLYLLGRYQEGRDLSPLRPDPDGPIADGGALIARDNAMLLRRMGLYVEAHRYAQAAVRDLTRRYGEAHEHTLAANVTLANCLRAVGQLTRARQLDKATTDTYRRVLGDDHPFTLAAATNLAIGLRAEGAIEDARTLDVLTLHRLEDVVGAAHPYALACASNMASDLAISGDTWGALEVSRRATREYQQFFSNDHPDALLCAANTALDLAAAGEHVEADRLRRTAFGGLRRWLGAEHPATIDAERGRRAEIEIEPSIT